MSYETYAHVQDMVEVEQKEAIKMKGINREIKLYAVQGRKEVVKTKAKVTKAKKPTKKELTKIEQLEKESLILKNESVQLRNELKFLKERIKKLEN
jgi:ribosomal 30S subunit maturation factor RimM